ncbi:hypothetical protein BC835DRAFT_1421513 [Cytidiella melzeri]|nr:hypothetical protein BC835DRAFT_1421513 [Cytidiella melzeri]
MVAKFSPPPAPQITQSSTHESCLNMSFAMASLPQTLDKPTVMWASDKDIPRYPGLYVSPNATTLPSTAPDNLPKNVGRLPLPWPWLFTRHANQLHYWTALTPKQSQYVGLLEPLSGLKVVQGPDRKWRLENVAEWRNLEAFMRKLLASMHRSFPLGTRTPLLVQVETDSFPWPQVYGYDRSWSSRKQARSYLSIVRGVFVINVAKLTYAGHLLPRHWVESLLERKLISIDEANLVQESVICQVTSPVTGTRIERLGLIVDVTVAPLSSTLENLTEVINQFELPVWLYFGLRPAISAHPWSAKYLPSAIELDASRRGPAAGLAIGGWGEEIEEVQSTADLQSLSDWQPANASSSSLAVPSSSPWGPPPAQSSSSAWATGSMGASPSASSSANNVSRPPGPLHVSALGRDSVTDQAPGETPQQFFARIDASKAAKLAKMSPAEKARVQAKERLHAALELPNKSHGCRVFKWSEDSSGAWIRTFVGRKNWRDAWANSAVSQRRYDPVRNEFDICEVLDLNAVTEDEEMMDSWYDDDDVTMTMQNTHIHPSPQPSTSRRSRTRSPQRRSRSPRRRSQSPRRRSRSPRRRSRSPRRRSRSAPRSRSPRRHSRSPRALPVIMPSRPLPPHQQPQPSASTSGTTPSSVPRTHSPVPELSMCNGITFSTALTQRYGIIEHTAQATYRNPETLLPDKKIYIMMGVYNETVLPQYSTPMRDFFTYLTSPPNEFVTPPPTLTDLAPGTTRGFPWHRRRDLIVQTVLDNRGCPWYFVYARDPRDNDVPYSLCLADPVSVNHLLRSEVSSSMFDVTRTLLSWGVPFNTLQPIADPRTLWASPPMPMYFNQVPLGLGIVEHKHKFTLDDYKAYVAKRDEIITSFQGRAALLRGGLLWRLARDSYADDSEVCKGPSGFAMRDNHRVLGDWDYVDDDLSLHQEDVICGVYRVQPESANAGPSGTAYRSWWPTAWTWSQSGMTLDYWSAGNERFFVNHRRAILEGTMQPKTAQEWRRTLSPRKVVKTNVVENARQLASRALPAAR